MQALPLRACAAIGLLLGLPALGAGCESRPVRSGAVLAEFQRAHPCPSTGLPRGPCPGYIKDHKIPLCAGGRDHPDNLQWQTVAEAKAKDVAEWRECRLLREGRRGASS